ncbi:unnamed protein product [Somion occarium]|uniref:Protein kinase domain-containing protein n=1 Tax=Somion occarium TaxID=3059160 RepID=A0ABP1D8W4_9APHY
MLESWGLHSRFLNPSSSSDASSSNSRSSHLSILTSTSSISSALSDAQAPSPPSPTHSNASGSSKTHAFFGSPFADGFSSPPPPPPPKLPSRASSVKSQSRTADFFGTPTADSHPGPPPNIHSLHGSPVTSPVNSPPSSPPASKTKVLPPLSRIFPSRIPYVAIDGLPSREPSFTTRRDFLYFDSNHPPHTYHPESPTSLADASASGSTVETPPTTSTATTAPSSTPGPSGLPTPIVSATVPRHLQPHEPERPPVPLNAGDLISDSSLTLELVRTLGQGAFSNVWLAKDAKNQLGALELSRKSSLIRSRSLKRGRSKRMDGTIPTPTPKPRTTAASRVGKKKSCASEFGSEDRTDSSESIYISAADIGGRPEPDLKRKQQSSEGRLVAVKMTDRTLCDKNDRTRVSFVREVEVLRHISHPSIVSYLHSFSTPSYHCLVLEYVGGGDLFDLIDSAESHAMVDEALIRRMFGELCKAVGWMHGVGLVHRDIKLENILLTCRPLTDPLPSLPAPLIKLTDFGLSRFIDPNQPLLTTRCGSESYAAPELVTGRPYDGRETDAWACGVVLYAMATRRLPFDRPKQGHHGPKEEAKLFAKDGDHNRAERKALLVRIAKGEYSWPVVDDVDADADVGAVEPLRGVGLCASEGIRRVVGKLLVREAKKREKVIDLWEDEWMKGDGAPIPPQLPMPQDELPGNAAAATSPSSTTTMTMTGGDEEAEAQLPTNILHNHGENEVCAACIDAFDDEDVDDGVLVDGDDIGPGSVARQEH